MIQSTATPAFEVKVITDSAELALARQQDERFARNLAWFEARASDIYRQHRGKCFCVSGQELFVGDSPELVVAAALRAHPDDNGSFTGYIPLKKMDRIYASRRTVARLR